MIRIHEECPNDTPWHLSLQHLDVAGLTWGSPGKPIILCLHGWLDNAASFSRLGPMLADIAHVVAVDLAGHGHSGHRPIGTEYALLEYVRDVASIIATLPVAQVYLVGHSLGGIIASLYASAFPDRVARLVMIDSIGPRALPEGQFVTQLRKALDQRLRSERRPPRIYPTRSDAVAARETGPLALSRWAAERIVERNLQAVDGGFVWRTDPRLRDSSMMYLSEAQVSAYLNQITMPSLLLMAESGGLVKWLADNDRMEQVKGLQVADVPGSHHCHLEAESAPAVASAIRNFLIASMAP